MSWLNPLIRTPGSRERVMLRLCVLLSVVSLAACASSSADDALSGVGLCGLWAHLSDGNCVEDGSAPDSGTSMHGADAGSWSPPPIGPNTAQPCLDRNWDNGPFLFMSGGLAPGFPNPFAGNLGGGDGDSDILNGTLTEWGFEGVDPWGALSDGGMGELSGSINAGVSFPQPVSAGASATFPATYPCKNTPPGVFSAYGYAPPGPAAGMLCPLPDGVQPYNSMHNSGETCGSGFASTVNVVNVSTPDGGNTSAVLTFSEVCVTTGEAATGCLFMTQ